MRNAYRSWWGAGTCRRRLEDEIKVDVREEGCENRRWMLLAQDRVRWRTSVFGVACSGSDTRVGFDPHTLRKVFFEKIRTVSLAFMRRSYLHVSIGGSVSF